MAARVAAWGLNTEQLRRVVGGVKRSRAYRRLSDGLVSRCPLDVWTEDGLGFVQFLLTSEWESGPGWAIFAVSVKDGQVVAAKSLTPDESGQQVIVSELLN